MMEALHAPVEQRVLRRLHELALMFNDGPDPVVVPVTREDLAQLAGTTRPSVNRVLETAESDGVVRVTLERIEILAAARLCSMAH